LPGSHLRGSHLRGDMQSKFTGDPIVFIFQSIFIRNNLEEPFGGFVIFPGKEIGNSWIVIFLKKSEILAT
jgi:hypothetical protein